MPATTLASIMEHHALPHLDFLKMDVEGFEFPILRASHSLLARHGTVTCFEFNTWCILAFTDDHPRLCLDWLLENFVDVFILRRANPPETQMERVAKGNARHLLAMNMMQDGYVSDLVVCTEPGKIKF